MATGAALSITIAWEIWFLEIDTGKNNVFIDCDISRHSDRATGHSKSHKLVPDSRRIKWAAASHFRKIEVQNDKRQAHVI